MYSRVCKYKLLMVVGLMSAVFTQSYSWAVTAQVKTPQTVYRVLYTSGAYVTDEKGLVVKPITANMELDDVNITVDVGGVLFLESPEDGGCLEILQNSSLHIKKSKIVFKTGEVVVQSARTLAITADSFGVFSEEGVGKAYLFARGEDSFFSLDKHSRKPVKVLTATDQDLVLKPGNSVLASGAAEPAIHPIVPKSAKMAMIHLDQALRYLKSDKKSDPTLRILHADDVEVAIPTAAGREFRKVLVGETFMLMPEFAPLTFQLSSDKSVFSLEYADGDVGKKIYNFQGRLLFELANKYKRRQ